MAESPVFKIIESIKKPQNLESFYGAAKPVTLYILAQPEPIVLPILSPFVTLYDLKLVIYKQTQIPPEHQFLARKPSKTIEKYIPIDYIWTKFGSTSELPLANPTSQKDVAKQSSEFVDSAGERKSIGYSGRLRILLENYSKRIGKETIELYLFPYAQIKGQYSTLSERQWYGAIYPYFPLLSYGVDTVSESLLATRVKQYDEKSKIVDRAEELLSSLDLAPTCAGVRYLQFQWLTRSEERNIIENLFYTVPVTKSLVYMRLMPHKATPVTKFHLTKDNVPDIADVKLLKQWTKERNPTPEHDFLLAKALIRTSIAPQPPLYMTLRMFEGGTADATIQPVKGVRKLDMFTDLDKLPEHFNEAIKNLPFAATPIQIINTNIIYGVKLPAKTEVFTRTRMKNRLRFFTPFFTEISPLPGENPIVMLRYKCVDNYATENRIFTYLTLVSNRKLVQGEALVGELVHAVEEEFQLDTDEARGFVAKWFKSKGEFQLVDGDSGVYSEVNNTGIEIAIFSQHPFYTFHLYNIDSITNLQRVLTLLSVLFSGSDVQLSLGVKTAAIIKGPIEEKPEEEKPEEENNNATPINDALFAQIGDDFGVDEFGADEFGADEEAPTTPSVKNLVQKNAAIAPRLELAATPVAPVETSAGTDESLANYFIRKLKEADLRLFEYTKEHPSMKKYVSMCAANVTRQPAIVSRAQFEEMRDVIYKKDIDSLRINFIVMPKEESDTAKNVKGAAETFYFLKYGTTGQKFNDNYYVCAKFFCGRDNLVLIEEDYKGTSLRRPIVYEDGTTKTSKAPNTCPFCEGTLVRNRDRPGPNETVIQREFAPNTEKLVNGKKTGKIHEYVGFLSKQHPEGFYMPCCFIKPESIYVKSKYYDKLRDLGVDLVPGKGLENADEEVPEVPAIKSTTELRPVRSKYLYMSMVKRVQSKFIVGSEKLPLEIDETEGPQIGLLPPLLDSYFDQTLSDLINPKGKIHELKKADARGFLRIGVENRARYKADSFLAAVAPFYNVEDAESMKNLIWQTLDHRPNIFLQLNYGNFLIEFYDVQGRFPTEQECQRMLHGTDTKHWEEAIQMPGFSKARGRFLCAFQQFREWLFSDTTAKEYRQFAQLLSLPNGLMRQSGSQSVPGITFIVLKLTQDGKLEVDCPAYSFNGVQHANNDIAFLLHHWSGVWEPIFYVDSQSTREPTTLLFQRAEESTLWPEIVRRRVAEFTSMDGCYSTGKFSYASRHSLNPKRMLPASLLWKRLSPEGLRLDGILRDPYNHLAALVLEDPGQNETMYIPVPCVDDGYVFPTTKIYLDWKDCVTGSLDAVLEFYETYVNQFSSKMYGSFKPKQIWYIPSKIGSSQPRGRVQAVLLENLQLIPINHKNTKNPSVGVRDFEVGAEGKLFYTYKDEKIPVMEKQLDELEWEINKKIFFAPNPSPDDDETDDDTPMTGKDLQDIYEHFRITFANWLSDNAENHNVRRQLEEVIASDTPLHQKRKELQIMLDSNQIMKWLSYDAPRRRISPIRRIDCSKQTSADSCSGRCVWKSDRCLLHAPDTTSVAGADVDTGRLFLYKLIDELLRFSEKRQEIFDNTISTLGFIDRDIIEGDQRIIPENTAAWYELLREDWSGTEVEKPRFFEEQSRRLTKEERALVPIDEESKLPPGLETLLDTKDPLTATLRLLRAPLSNLFSRIGFRFPPTTTKSSFTKEDLQRITRSTKFPILQIDIRKDIPDIIVSQMTGQVKDVFVLVITPDSPALLVKDPQSDELPTLSQLPSILRKRLLEETPPAPKVDGIRVALNKKKSAGIRIVKTLPTVANPQLSTQASAE